MRPSPRGARRDPVSAGPRARFEDPRYRRPQRRTGLWVPALLSTLAVATVIGGIAVGQFYWSDLRSSMGRMDQTLDHARERQRQMVEHFSQAQGLLLAQQRRLQEAEEALRLRESELEAQRADLEAARARLALVSASREALAVETRVRELARRLDRDLLALADPGGLDAVAATLLAITDWAAGSPDAGAGPPVGAATSPQPGPPLVPALRSALADSRDTLAAAQAADARRLAERIERLGVQATTLSPGPPQAAPGSPPSGLPGSGAGHLGEQIQTALFALHRGDEALFRLAFDTARAWLAAFYDPARPEVQAVQSELAALRRIPVGQDLGPLRTALARLRAVLGELIEAPGSSGAATPQGVTGPPS